MFVTRTDFRNLTTETNACSPYNKGGLQLTVFSELNISKRIMSTNFMLQQSENLFNFFHRVQFFFRQIIHAESDEKKKSRQFALKFLAKRTGYLQNTLYTRPRYRTNATSSTARPVRRSRRLHVVVDEDERARNRPNLIDRRLAAIATPLRRWHAHPVNDSARRE